MSIQKKRLAMPFGLRVATCASAPRLVISAMTLALGLSFAPFTHAASVDVGLAFDGASIHNAVPWHVVPELVQTTPDSNGAVGPDHVVVMVNGRFAVHQKSDGALLQEKDLVVFWGDSGADIGPVADYSVWDPRILYDSATQRWFAVSVGAPLASIDDVMPVSLLLAVSRTTDPTQEWAGFEINTDPDNGGGNMDYPTLGVNADGVYVAGKMLPFTWPMNKLLGIDVLVIPKSDLLAATPTIANATLFVKVPWGDESESRRNAQPVVDLDGGGLPETLVDFSATSPKARPITMQINGPITAPTLGERRTVAKVRPTSMSWPVSADQPGDKPNLYVGMGSSGSAVKRNGTIWAVQNLLGEKYGNDAIRWLRIDPEQNKVIESGVIEHPDLDLSYPSIAVNDHDDVVIGVSGSSETQYGSAYALAGQTLGGVTFFGDLELLVPGVADYYINAADYFPGAGTRNGWNDYTTTVVDPSDPHTFWTFQEYVSAVDEWSVAAVEMSFVGCEGIADGPAFESLRCRIHELRGLVAAESQFYGLQKKLANDLRAAGKHINKARARCTQEKSSSAIGKVMAAAKRMQKCIDRLDDADAELSPELREEYKAAATPIQQDAVLLQGQVACPDDAPW